jgi:hypothetical protein
MNVLLLLLFDMVRKTWWSHRNECCVMVYVDIFLHYACYPIVSYFFQHWLWIQKLSSFLEVTGALASPT